MRQELQELNLHHIVPAINSLVDEWFNNDEVITIDKLQIDVGNIATTAGPADWIQKIKEQLELKLKPFAGGNNNIDEGIIAQKQQKHVYLKETLIYFLQNGLLPPGSLFRNLGDLKKELFLTSNEVQAAIKIDLLGLPTHLLALRLVSNFALEEIAFFLHLFQPAVSLQNWVRILLLLKNETIPGLVISVQNNSSSWNNPQQLLQTVLREYLLTIVAETALHHQLSVIEAEKILEQKIEDVLHTQNVAVKKEKTLDALLISKTSLENTPVNNDPSQWVSNAGLCLLSPWLTRFFAAIGLWKEDHFVTNEHQQHAIYILHYVATGETDATEEKLVFAKLLCGWPWQMPSINSMPFSEEEIRESDLLLQSVIAYWTILKNTSPQGLREGFLSRQGKLTRTEDHYLLQPEQQGIDVLLEHIPWGFRNIMLPWMKKPVVVEWY